MTEPVQPQPRRRFRWWPIAIAALVVCLAATITIVHLPFVQTRALSWVVSSLEKQGLRLEAGRLEYNLFALRVTMRNVRLTGDHATDPFFEADLVRLDVPWAILGGGIRVQSVEVVRPRVTVIRGADGTLNLPTFGDGGDGGGIEGPIRLGRLLITDLTFRYDDATRGQQASTGNLSVDMNSVPSGPLNGRLSSVGGTTLRIGDISTTTTVIDGGMSFDGNTLTVDAFTLEAPELQVRLDGDVDVIGAEPQMNLRYALRVDAARVAPWAGLDPAPTGRLALTGTATGALDAPSVTTAIVSEELIWPELGPVALDARGSWSGSTATIDAARLGVAGGEINAEGHIQTDDAAPSDMRARWANIDVQRLSRLAPDLPVRIASIADGTITAAWTGSDVTGADADLQLSLRAAASPAGTLPLAGRARLQLADRQWTLTTRQDVARSIVVDANARGRLAASVDDLMTSTLTGRTVVTIADLGAAVRGIESAGLSPALGIDGRLRGATTATLSLRGTFETPRAVGTVDMQDVWFDTTGPATLRTAVDASPRTVILDGLHVELGANTIDAEARIGVADNSLAGTLTAALPQLGDLTASLPEAWRPRGAAAISATFAGALDNPAVDVVASSQDIRVAGQTVRTLQTNVQLANRVATISSFELTQDAGRLTAAGRYDIDTRTYTFTATGDDLVITPLILAAATTNAAGEVVTEPIPIDARFDLQLAGSGTVDTPKASGTLDFEHVNWGAYQIGQARAELSVDGDRAQTLITVPSIAATIDATMGIAAGTIAATIDVSDADIAALARASGPASPAAGAEPPPVVGTVSLHATAQGLISEIANAAVTVDLSRADATVNGVAIRLEQAAQLRYGGDAFDAESVAIRIGDARLTAHGRFGPGAAATDALEVALTGAVNDFLPMVRLAEGAEDVQASGAIAMRVRATGSFRTPEVLAYLTLTEASVATADIPAVTDLTMAASYSAGLLNVNTLTGQWQGATLAASMHIPIALLRESLPAAYLASLPVIDAPARGDIHVTNLTPSALTPFVASETVDQLAGRVDFVANVEATALDLESVSADVTLTHADVEMARLPLAQTHPTQLRFANRRLDVVEWSWAGEGTNTYFDVAGYVYFADEVAQLNLGASGSIDLRMISAISRDVATSGRADFEVRALGSSADPLIAGRMMLADTDIIIRDPRVAITELAGEVVFTPNRVQFNELKANANGGTLAIAGAVDYTDFAVSGGQLTVSGRQLAFEVVEGLRTEVNADLTLGVADNEPRLTGRVTIVRGDYRRPFQLTEQLFALSSAGVETIDDETPGALDRLQLDIAVVSAEDIVVDNNYGRIDISSNLRVIGTGGNPVLAGRLTLREGGEVFLGGQTYQVRRGTVDFTNATRIEPTINLALETRVQRDDITLEVVGTPQTLEVSLRSPGRSQQDAISLLLTGQVADESTMAYSEVARGQLLMLLSGELLGVAGRSVGFDSVQVSRGLGGAASTFDLLATESDPDTRLTISKNLSRYLELIFSQSLRESGDITWIASYRPGRRVEFRGTTDDDSNQTYEFRHEVEFGGGPYARPAQTARVASTEPYVGAVEVKGDAGFSDAEIRGRLRLKVGDQFDYYRWQDDRDRVLEFFHDRGFFEARLTARREAMEDGRTRLDYELRRGPQTTLTVDGYALPSRIVNRMKTAWTQAVFDGFLTDDFETMAREELVSDNHLQAEINVVVNGSSTTDTKTIAVNIVPGPRYAERLLSFEGNTEVADSALNSAIEARRLEHTAWQDPNEVAAALKEYYRSLGYLLAEVSAGTPVFNGTAATQPFRITEDEAFTLGTVEVAGPVTRTPETVRNAAALQPGDAYRPNTIEPARRRVEVEYMQAGYNHVRVTAAVLVDSDAHLANVVLNVNEGPQQVLAELEVSGADITSRTAIEDAVRVKPGTPVDMSQYFAAQKRLYDLGVFQSVDVLVNPVRPVPEGTLTEPARASIVVQELPRFRFRYGFRASDITESIEGTNAVGERRIRPGIVADLLNRNVLGRAISLGVAGQVEFDRWLGRGIVSFPSLFHAPVTTNLFLTQQRETFDDTTAPFVEESLDVTFEQRFKPARSMTVIWGYSFTKEHTFGTDLDPTSVFEPLDSRLNIARLTGTYAWDTRNDPSNAARGSFHSSTFEWGSTRLGSDLPFVRYLTQQFYFRPVGRTVLASAVRLGLGRGLGQDIDLESSERFYAGGSTTVRGFGEDSLGPRDGFGVTGGNSLLVFNQEARFPVYRWVRGVAFLDAGNVFPTVRELSIGKLEVGTGFGLRIDSPFAVIRIDYGTALTSRDREPRGRWYFAFGQTF